MLGYWVDLDRIAPACERAQQERVDRAREIIERLNALGVEVTFEEALAEAGAADSIGRPHIARAAGAGPDLGPFFEEYLVPGAKAFVARALAERRAGRRADPRRGRGRRRRPSLLGRVRAGAGPRPGHEPAARRRPGRDRDLLSLPHPRADCALPRALRRARPGSRPRPRTSTAPPTRRSPAWAPTTPTGSASRGCRPGRRRAPPWSGPAGRAQLRPGFHGAFTPLVRSPKSSTQRRDHHERRQEEIRSRRTLALAGARSPSRQRLRGAQPAPERRPGAKPIKSGAGPGWPQTLHPSDFVARVDNPWFPLKPGSRWRYRGVNEGTADHRQACT